MVSDRSAACFVLCFVQLIFKLLLFTEQVHDPNSNLEVQRGILNKTPEQLSEYLSI